MQLFDRRTGSIFLIALPLTLLLAVLLAAAAPAQELLANGSFESLDTDGGPENWGVRDWGGTKLATHEIVGKARLGQRCLQLQGVTAPLLYGCFSYPVTLPEGENRKLLLTLHYRTDNAPMGDISVTTFAEDFAAKEWETPALTSEAISLEASKSWRTRALQVDLLPAARQAVVVIRIHGAGKLQVDGVSLRPYPADVACELLQAGIATGLGGERECRVRLTNQTRDTLPVRGQLQVKAARGWRSAGTFSTRLSPGKAEELAVKYSHPLSESAQIMLEITSDQGDVIHEHFEAIAPPLIEGRITSPAFRATILQSVPTAEIAASGYVNASPELRRRLTLGGRLVGLGMPLPEVACDEQGRWQVRTPLTGMLTGNYGVQLQAHYDGREIAQTTLALLKPEPRGAEAAYDERLRLHVSSQVRFPLGAFMAVDEADLAAVAQAGFNTAVLPSRLANTAMLAQAEKLGLTVIISSASSDKDFWQNLYTRLGNSPLLAGYYVLQRPEAQTPPTTPAAMAALHKGLVSLDPRHPVCLAAGSMSQLESYAAASDIFMPWTDPEPVGDLRSVDALVSRAVQACEGLRPVWPVLQMTGAAYSSDSRLDPQTSGRPPTAQEYRCMAYLALARGAQGLFSYAYRLPAARGQREFLVTRDAPTVWQEAAAVNKELQALSPVLLDGEPVAVECGNPAIAVRGLRYNGVTYILAANPQAAPAAFSLKVPGMATDQLETAFVPRQIKGLGAGEFADQIEAQGARVYMGR